MLSGQSFPRARWWRWPIDKARRYWSTVLQAVSHMPVDVQALDCDFFVFSGHKVFAPTGIGVLFGKAAVLEAMLPWQGGGNMITDVTFDKTFPYQPPPLRFEAGMGNIADAVGLGARNRLCRRTIGMETIARYEHELLEYATGRPAGSPACGMIGTARGEGGRSVIRARWFPYRGRRRGAGSRRDRGSFRPSLRAAGAASLRSREHRARVPGPLQHSGRHRRTLRGAAPLAGRRPTRGL